MNRYWLFIIPSYYPGGGMNDFEKSFNSLEEAMKYYDDSEYRDYKYNWAEIYDSLEHKVIKECIGDDGVKSWKDE